jgi:hypothetical protein
MPLIKSGKLPVLLLILFILMFGISYILSITFNGPYDTLPSVSMVRGTSEEGRFSISYPSTWDFSLIPLGRSESNMVAGISSADFPKLGVYIFIRRSIITHKSLTEVANWGRGIASTENAYREIAYGIYVIGKEETYLSEYIRYTSASPIQGPQEIRCYGNYRLHNSTGYAIDMCVDADDFPKVAPTFRRILESFEYLE